MVERQRAEDARVRRPPSPRGSRAVEPPVSAGITRIGEGIVIAGEVSGGEDLVIDGQVDGTIELPHHVLTVGPAGRVKAEVSAKTVEVLGKASGRITASELMRIGETGSVEGSVSAARLVVVCVIDHCPYVTNSKSKGICA